MENSIFTGLSRQMALETQMDIIANNVANMSTPGYRAQNMVFSEYVEDPKGADDPLSMVIDYGHYQNNTPGPIRQTGNPLDIALQGPGYIGIVTPEGTMYSRAGAFQLNTKGELVTGAGHQVAGAGGGPIVIPEGSTEVKIAEDGSVTTGEGQIGQIMVAEFENVQDLEATGNGLYKTDAAAITPAENTRVMQGMLEGSNVNSILEMTRMIDVLRAYQSTQRMLQNEHDRERNMIRTLSQSR
jgi:flagellar basal-body rod protein FlgF